MSVSVANRKLVNHFSLDSLLLVSSLIAAIAGVALAALIWFNIGGMISVIATMFVMFGMNGIIAACANAAALNSVPNQIAGSAAALVGALQYGSGIVSSALLALFSDGTPWTMAWIIALFVVLSAVMAMWAKRKV